MEEGGKVAEILRRQYVPLRQQLLQTARWGFARKQVDLALLADRCGQFANFSGNIQTEVIRPWRFEYVYPIDCLQIRFVPHSGCWPNAAASGLNPAGGQTGNPALAAPAGTPGYYSINGVNTIGSLTLNQRQLRPARFLKAVDPNYPGLIGSITDWSQMPDLETVIGVGLTSRTVILTNVHRAQAVYTADIEAPDQWDPLFQQAFVALLASHIALPVAIALDQDKKFALEMRNMNSVAAKQAIGAARVANANETVSSTDSTPDWIHVRFRDVGWGGDGWGGNDGGAGGEDDGGVFGYGCEPTVFGNGSSF